MIEPRGSVVRKEGPGVTDAQARKSALLVAAVLLLMAAWNLYRGRTTVVIIFALIGAALFIAGLFAPAAARAFHKAWMRLAVALGHVNSRVLLTLMYYLVFTPYGLASRLLGRDPLRRRGRAGESYWTERAATRQTREAMGKLVLDNGWNWWLAFVVAVPIGVGIALLIDRFAIRPLRERKSSPTSMLLVTVGITQLLTGISLLRSLSANTSTLQSKGYPLPFTATAPAISSKAW